MSFSVGPVIGKKEAVIKHVQEFKSDSEQWAALKPVVLAELEALPPGAPAFIRAQGHHWESGRSFTLELNPSYPYATPQLVE